MQFVQSSINGILALRTAALPDLKINSHMVEAVYQRLSARKLRAEASA
jgi:hypothetical protein